MWLRLSTYPSNEARTYLGRLFNADKVRKPERGRYTPVTPPKPPPEPRYGIH
jgi:hypothetical protein